MDVNMEDAGEPSRSLNANANAPRLYHKKSRTGCARCKQRRVKCDERRPSCTGCSRHTVECVYPLDFIPNSAPMSSRRAASSLEAEGMKGRDPDLLQYQTQQHGLSPSSGRGSSGSTSLGQTPDASISPGPSSTAAAPSPHPTASYYYPPFRPPFGSSQPSSFTAMATDDPDSIPDPAESRHRRLWELRLMHNYVNILQQTRQPHVEPIMRFDWSTELALLGFQDDGILYALLALSALNLLILARDERERDDLQALQTMYLGMALRGQRAAVACLSRETADRVCMGSLTILHHAYALVQTTIQDDEGNWQPPLEWLRIGRGTGTVFTVARGLLLQPRPRTTDGSDGGGGGGGGQHGRSEAKRAQISEFLSSPPMFDMDEIFTEANREPYLWLLDDPDTDNPDPEDCELEDQVTRKVYEGALSYTGWTERFIKSGEADFAVERRLAAFAVWMSELFQTFCQQHRPRALVVLAWFFRLWIPYEHRWTVNETGRRMVRGIYGALDERWRVKLEPIFVEYGL